MQAVDAVAEKFMDPLVTYVLEGQNGVSGGCQQVTVSGSDLNRHAEYLDKTNSEFGGSCLSCSYMCSKAGMMTTFISLEKSADVIDVSIFSNHSRSTPKPTTPVVEYYPAVDDVKILVVEHDLDVVCYATKDMPLASAISKLLVPALVDQLYSIRKKMLGSLLRQHSQLRPYHFVPPGFLHPVTVIYDLKYGETEIEQEEVRRSVHLRLGLPMDRPLLRVANAIHLTVNDSMRKNSVERGLLKDVHLGIPSSGVSGGRVSLVQGSYEYYHYLLDGFDDSGWGCAYRSLQTIISWFRLQHYTGIGVPSHREIQQTLVEMGDKDPPFIGSREWIGAIELSFVLDKLLGVSCKVINVRSGADLPEKCRELALHFETQGTPIMIGGGVLAYTLLGVDYNEVSGDCAFLILDPHYTGNDDLKKIVNGGWCGWKKAVDSKGKHFFLHDKFYNLLLPQRPFMV